MIEPIDQKLRRISGLYSRIGSVGYLQRYRYRGLNQKTQINIVRLLLQGIPAFRDFTIRDPRYFVIQF